MMSLAQSTTKALRPLVRQAVPVRSMTVMNKQSSEEYKKKNYDARMKKTGRPVSPHVTIYAFPITALSSITNRATGMCLSFGCISLGTVEILGGSGSAMSLMESIGSSSVFLAAPAKFAVTFPLIYHYCGAVRHTMWDKNPEMLTNEDTAKSSYAIFGGSLLVSVGAMFL